MDHLRDNHIIQLFFFSVVGIIGLYLYMQSPEIPEQNTYHYVQSAGLLGEERDLLGEDGFELESISLSRAEGSDSIVIATLVAHVPDTCTVLQKVKETYVNREFQITMVPVEKPNAVCQALKTEVVTETLIDMGALSLGRGEYAIKVQELTQTFDMQTLPREGAQVETATSTDIEITDLSAALGDLFQ